MTKTATKTAINRHAAKIKPAESLDSGGECANIEDVETQESGLLPLHRATFRRQPVPSPNVGIPGEMAWLALADLRIDPRYQRPINAAGLKTISAIVEGFDWSKFSPLVVARRPGGLFAVIDGQHRATGALTHGGVDRVPCLIMSGGARAEAAAFAIINGQVTAVTKTQIHVARVMAGDPKALRLNEIVARGGVTIVKNPKPIWKVGETIAVGAIEVCLNRWGEDALITALQCITETGNGNPGQVRSPIIQGICYALALRKDWRNAGERLFQAIESIGVAGIYATARKVRAAKSSQGAEWVHVANVVRELLVQTLDKRKGRD
jgi:hypothetical protein